MDDWPTQEESEAMVERSSEIDHREYLQDDEECPFEQNGRDLAVQNRMAELIANWYIWMNRMSVSELPQGAAIIGTCIVELEAALGITDDEPDSEP